MESISENARTRRCPTDPDSEVGQEAAGVTAFLAALLSVYALARASPLPKSWALLDLTPLLN